MGDGLILLPEKTVTVLALEWDSAALADIPSVQKLIDATVEKLERRLALDVTYRSLHGEAFEEELWTGTGKGW